MAAKASPNSSQNRALVVGVSDYPDPSDRLPGVAADVREMAKLLGSKKGGFKSGGVSELTDQDATRQRILSELEASFAGAAANETVFVYFAGHGAVAGNDYFFVAYDTDAANLATTGVPLTAIKALFDSTASRRAFLWLDFCHSGGILARRPQADDMSTIRRSLEVIKGEGKVIVAACTSTQLAYESSKIGHGLFTHALLRGLKGEAKSAEGEVTALSLYDFIDRQVASDRQQPVFLGEMKGRIVLMHCPDRGGVSDKTVPSIHKKPSRKKIGTWIMLGENFFHADSVTVHSGGTIEIVVVANGGEDEAALTALRPDRSAGRSSLPFAANNDAHVVRVRQANTHTAGGRQAWTLTLSIETDRGGTFTEMSFNGMGPDEIARRRASRLLLNDPPALSRSRQSFGADSLFDGVIEGMSNRYPIRECVIRSVFHQHGTHSNWKEFARLKAVFYLKITGIVEHVLDLTIGPVRKNEVKISFRGRRPQHYSNMPTETIELNGSCQLGGPQEGKT